MALQTVNVFVINFHICKLKIVTESALVLVVKITGANRYNTWQSSQKKWQLPSLCYYDYS